jgi:hypothetical protein
MANTPVFVTVHRRWPGRFRAKVEAPKKVGIGNEGFSPVTRIGDAAANPINFVNFIWLKVRRHDLLKQKMRCHNIMSCGEAVWINWGRALFPLFHVADSFYGTCIATDGC